MSTSPDAYPQPGARIGPYQTVRQLGMGGMGIVYEAVDTVLNRRVALKVISPHLADDPTFRVRFTNEAQSQASLDSPHVVQVFAHGEADGSLYIASQLIPDGDLGAMIRANGAPPPRIAVDILMQIASGLADAHRTGLVHRDIKPANVLLRIREEEVAAYLADFGIARRTDADHSLTTQGFAVGTPTFMAPELHTGGAPGPMSDVYSLGCLLWAALVGRAPYTGTTDYQVVSAHLSAPVPQLAAYGPWEQEVNRILRTAMAKAPGDRYASAAALRDDLRHVLRDLPAPSHVQPGSGHEHQGAATTAGHRVGGPAAPGTAARRRTGWIVGLSLAAVLVLIGVVVGSAWLIGRDGRGGGGDEPVASDSTDQFGLDQDEQRAAANIAAALQEDGDLDPAEAECTARELVLRTGIDGLQDKGVLDEDLEWAASNGDDVDPSVLADIFAVTFSCVFETATFGSSPTAE